MAKKTKAIYQVVIADFIVQLEKKMTELLSDGWLPVGGISVMPGGTGVMQAVVRYGDE